MRSAPRAEDRSVRRVDVRLDRATLARLAARPGAALLEGWSDAGTWRILAAWPEEVRSLPWSRAAEWPALLRSIDAAPIPYPGPSLPFVGGWIGFVSYEAGAALIDGDGHGVGVARATRLAEPAAWFARHRRALLVDPEGRTVLVGPERLHEASLADLAASPPEIAWRSRDGMMSDSLGDGAYSRAVGAVREAIARGDVYQVNLTRAFVAPPADPVDLYLALTGEAPPRCSAFLRGRGWEVISASPEVFLAHDDLEGTAESRPIKGTVRRAGQDEAEIAALLGSAKDAAEHVMIVDLVRNDLGKVAPAGQVTVARSRDVLTLAHVHHLESTVRATGLQGVPLADVFAALFPGGSITGAPKRAAVQQLRGLEPVARGVYTGAIGFRDDRGRSQWSVAIRTAVTTPASTRYHAGGGIVWDSDPSQEEAESRAKSVAFLDYFGGGAER